MNKEVYNFLNSARVIHWQILKLKSKHDELESCLLPAGIRYDKDRVQTTPEDSVSKIVAEINSLERRITALQHQKAKRIEEIDEALNMLPDEEKTALSMRFINRIPVNEIAEQMGFAVSTIYKFMDKGADRIKSIRNIK